MEFVNPEPKYVVNQDDKKVVITLEVKNPAINTYMIVGFMVWFVVYAFYKLGPSSGFPTWLLMYVLFLGTFGAWLGVYLSNKFRPVKSKTQKYFIVRTLVLNKETCQLDIPSEKFSISFEKIKDIKIIEIRGLFGSQYFYKLSLENGEKTITFPFHTYSKAEEILGVINANLK